MKPSARIRKVLLCAILPIALLNSHAATIPLVQHESDWRYRKGTNEPPADWHSVADASLDETWLTGPGGFGYGDGDDATVLTDMQGNYVTVYTRQTFMIDGPLATNLNLRLEVDYDDAYVAYLDGVEISRSDNVPSTPHPFDAGVPTDSAASVEGGAIDITNLGAAADLLAPGPHILAVQGINGDAPSSDLSLIADLVMEEIIITNPDAVLSGSITEDTTLYASNAIYTVTADVTVEVGVTLTIEPGVGVQFDAGTGMTVLGRLLADGTESDPIRFTRSTAGTTWERIMFIEAEPSLFRHCIVEFSDCAGDHKDYYDNDGDPSTPPLPRTYFQAIVALACHLDFENCLFQNLPNDGAGGQGDAIALISDDVEYPGRASASVRNSEFIGIGQAIHTRFAYVFVEGCYFTEHNGDNDDIDMYGESLPPSLIVNNVFLDPNSDDAMNPTRSSAVMIGNTAGHTGTGRQGDSGVVLRDRCCPVMINNVIFNANSAGIDVQNTCDALLVNNTVVNCGTGINFRDHTLRWGDPYYLTPGAASATLINNIIWDCGTALNLVDSPSANQPGSIARVSYCNIEGGQGSVSVSANSSLLWGEGIIDANPLFADLAANDYHLTATSPCIDTGTAVNEMVSITNETGLLTNLTITVTTDRDGVFRPLDGDGQNGPAFDMGAYEFLAPDADSNGDGVPDGWYAGYGLNPTDETVGAGNPDFDGFSTYEEWIADTDPTDGESVFTVESISLGPPITVQFRSSANRIYTLYYTPDQGSGDGSDVVWTVVPGREDVAGSGGTDTLTDDASGAAGYYKIEVDVP